MAERDGFTLTPKSAAAIVGVSPDTIRRMADAGKLVHFRLPSGHRRFRREDVVRLFAGEAA